MIKLKPGNWKQHALICPVCMKEFFVSHYRATKESINKLSCSYKCAAILRVPSLKERSSLDVEIIIKMKDLYLNTNKHITKIADELDISRSTIFNYIKKEGWKRLKRPSSLRIQYRKLASEKIGRPLLKYEHVHHIDFNTRNNEASNLHVYKDAQQHTLAHRSLETCAIEFYKLGLIVFNEKTGLYQLK